MVAFSDLTCTRAIARMSEPTRAHDTGPLEQFTVVGVRYIETQENPLLLFIQHVSVVINISCFDTAQTQ